jgi:hypothetical protein
VVITVIATNALLWLLGSTLYFTGWISGTQAVILGIVGQTLPIMIRLFNRPIVVPRRGRENVRRIPVANPRLRMRTTDVRTMPSDRSSPTSAQNPSPIEGMLPRSGTSRGYAGTAFVTTQTNSTSGSDDDHVSPAASTHAR